MGDLVTAAVATADLFDTSRLVMAYIADRATYHAAVLRLTAVDPDFVTRYADPRPHRRTTRRTTRSFRR